MRTNIENLTNFDRYRLRTIITSLFIFEQNNSDLQNFGSTVNKMHQFSPPAQIWLIHRSMPNEILYLKLARLVNVY